MNTQSILRISFVLAALFSSYGQAATTKIDKKAQTGCKNQLQIFKGVNQTHPMCSLGQAKQDINQPDNDGGEEAEFIGVSDSLDQFPEKTNINATELAEYFQPGVSQLGKFIWARVPNRGEMAVDAIVCIPLEILLERGAGLNLGDSANAKSLVRDLGKLVTAVVKSIFKTEVAGSGKSYDISNVLSQLSKPGIKLPVYYLLVGRDWAPGIAGAIANFPGDIVARTWIKLGEDYQAYLTELRVANATGNLTGKPMSFGAYVGDNIYYVPAVLAQASLEVTPKIAVASFFGWVLAKLGLNRACDWLVYSAANVLALGVSAQQVIYASQVGPNGKSTYVPFGTNVGALTDAGSSLRAARFIAGGALIGATTLKFVINSLILSTVAKSTMDGVGQLSKQAHASYIKEHQKPCEAEDKPVSSAKDEL